MKVLFDRSDVVSVDLRDVDQSDLAVVQLKECPIRGDALHGRLDDRSDF